MRRHRDNNKMQEQMMKRGIKDSGKKLLSVLAVVVVGIVLVSCAGKTVHLRGSVENFFSQPCEQK